MEVILTQDVAKLGRRYDIVDVPNGRALNMLIPQGLAMTANAENRKRIKSQSDKVAAERAAASAAFAAAVEKLDGEAVTVTATANKKGHLFEALKEESIAEALSEKGVSVEATQVIIAEPIKEVGTHEVSLSNGDERISLSLEVVAA
ncbi:MAG TPA: 50S ribosomal protein L9 [Candidatus Paceibacterota bacterium]|nr:50S ribosomal protein L9 [Candidatus Paceibacterota bacterium]